jgi:hypothetical protein
MNSHRYIYRLKARTANASPVWWVSIDNAAGKEHARFGDHEYGGEAEALAAAIKFRDAAVARLGLTERLVQPESGHPGVSRTESERAPRGRLRRDAYWQAYWPRPDGTQATKRFSVNKFGEERAKQLAIRERERALNAIERGEDPFFVLPPPKQALWRYMDFTKFLAMLEDRALFFSAASNFDDPYEGAVAAGNAFKRKFVLSRSTSREGTTSLAAPQELAINCWYSAKHESAAMWSLYAKSGDAIAVKTSFTRLRHALPPRTRVGLVLYVDYTQSWIPEEDPIHRYFHKRLSFQHENELRAAIDLTDPQIDMYGRRVHGGFKVGIDLNRLIQEVFIGPKSTDWFVELVVAICRKYELKATPVRSSLYDGPIL